jgi:subtilisin family serine protease
MWFQNYFTSLTSTSTRRRQIRRSAVRLGVETLEDRRMFSFSPVAGFPVGGADPQAVLTADFGSLRADPDDYDDTRILVRFRPEVSVVNGLRVLDGTTVGRELPLVSGLHEVRLAPGIDVERALAIYRANPLVSYAQPNYRVHAQQTPNDPGFMDLWGLHNAGQTGGTPDADIDAPEAWEHSTGNGSTIVAVIDTGVDYNHSDLAANMWTNAGEIRDDGFDNDGNGIVDDYFGANFVYRDASGNPTGDPIDDYFHGTHVAGTIGAIGDNGVGVTGVSWNVQIMAIKFLDAWGYGYTSDAIDGLNYAVSMGAMISNNSWGGGPYDQGLYHAIQSAGLNGHLFVAAAGNSGLDADFDSMYPAALDLDNIISVAATDHNDQLAWFSNYGATSVDLGAPGVDVYSTFPSYMTDAMFEYGFATDYATISGTSMAAPHVAGVASLIRDLHPDWSAQQVKQQLLGTVDPIAGLAGITVTGGRLNAAAAVSDDVRLQIRDVTVTEGNTGTVEAAFIVTLSDASTETITVAFASSNGTATAGSDYQAASGILTFVPGETSKSITVRVSGDRLGEPNEIFFVNLAGATNAVISDVQGRATVVDDEPRISISDFTKAEGKNRTTTLFTFTVTLSAAYDQPVTMSFRTVNGTATTSGKDYVAKSGTLTFAPGETTKIVTIEVTGDNKREAHETFYIELFGNNSNSLFTKNRGIGTILNDD